ncbi:RNA polymerase sigma factor [Steroidobacter flavus]|uniref:RNA polymerase sigma factor n=1 Tax=Steroidobacter flavus TaxID=1842136 RepID=A0ABV8SUQ6_9GAMM
MSSTEPSAWAGEQWRHLRPDLLRFLARRLGSLAQAEDLLQDLWLKLASYRPGDKPRDARAFLFHAAANLALNHRVQDRRRAELRAQSVDILWAATEEATPERNVLAAESLDRVARAMDNLPERTRQILIWHRFEGLQQTEIAQRMGISVTAVEKHVRNAIAHLADVLEAEQP